MRSPLCAILLAVFAGALTLAPADAQINRRDRLEPEIVIEDGGRMGTCDFLTFTDDGKHLIAVGDDKVVRIWDFDKGTLQPAKLPVLRWSVWREQRGSIYALALSPADETKDNKYLAIGGLGALTTTVAVLDRATGEIRHSVTPREGDHDFLAVWSVAFAPSGKQVAFGTGDGSVFVWDFQNYRRCGQHMPQRKAQQTNTVRLVHFLNEDTVLSVADDGTVSKWDVSGNKIKRTDLPRLTVNNGTLIRATISPDRQWLVGATKGPVVAVRSLDGKQVHDFTLKDGEFPRSIAFDPRHENRLAISVGSLVAGSKFHIEAADTIRFYDLSSEGPMFKAGPPHSYRAEFLAFHTKKNYLAVAGGDNHEVTLWNLDELDAPAALMRGAGSCLWGVAVSADGKQIAFQDHRDTQSPDPNKRGTGAWRVFDLPTRQWRDAGDFTPVKQLAEADGWKIKPHPTDPNQWYAVSPNQTEHLLPRFADQENMPRCYTFIKAAGKKPTRLAVGHYWGLSLYELTEKEVRRTRVFAGHQGEVVALAVADGQSWIVSAANDQTIAAWNIGDTFGSQPILGAEFAIERGRLLVKKVDVGSPAWEAGLLEDDEVVKLGFDAADVPLDRSGDKGPWLKRLKDPVPGKELYFEITRGGRPEPVKIKTTVRHRPLWRFFPTRDGEWALWMWRNSFYDCSTKGDSYIGFHVNDPSPKLDQAPKFYRAERFRKVLERPDVIDKLLTTRDISVALAEVSDNPMPLSFDRFEQAAVGLEIGATPVTNEDVDVTVKVAAVRDNTDYEPARAELWINDHRLCEWENPTGWEKKDGKYTKKVLLPNAKLAVGRNTVTFLMYNRVGGRAEIATAIDCKRQPAKPHKFALAVGVNDYSAVKGLGGARGKLVDLTGASNDAKKFEERWLQQDPLYAGKPDVVARLDKTANRDAILKALDDLAQKVGPDDNCVVLLAGHGLSVPVPMPKGESPPKGEAPRTTFVFCGHDFDLAKPVETGISIEVLYAKLAAIQGHKVVIVDACHAGEAAVPVRAVNAVRGLAPGGQGPVIMAACDRNQESFEFPKEDKDSPRHGLFTYAILEALGEKFKEADANHDGELDAAEIYWYARKRMPALLKQIKLSEDKQVPIMFAPAEKMVPLARLPEK